MKNKKIRGKDLNHWKANAEEDYMKVPISVLKYISILEEQLEQQGLIGKVVKLKNKISRS